VREYPVGSVCIIVQGDGTIHESYVGVECTIEAGIAKRECVDLEGVHMSYEGYLASTKDAKHGICVKHVNLKLKRFPGQLQSWLNEKMNDLMKPKNIVEEEV
jgi:hypothetical protein